MKRIFAIVLIAAFAAISPCYGQSQQTSGRTAQDIIDYARWEYLNEPTASAESFWDDDTKLLNILNRGILDVVALSKCLETTETITILTAVTEYSIQSDYLSVEKAVYSGATTAASSSPLKGLKKVDLKDLAHNIDVGEPVNYYIWGDRIGIDPYPSSGVSGYNIYLYLVKRPSSLTALTDSIPTPAQYDHALTMFVAAHAFRKDRQLDRANALMQEYLAEVTRFREDYIDGTRKAKEK